MLERKTQAILDHFYKRNQLTHREIEKVIKQPFQSIHSYEKILNLHRKGYIECVYGDTDENAISKKLDIIEITDEGRAYIEQTRYVVKEKREDRIRYWITTAIAVVALIVAVIALSAELCLIELPRP